ncbi:MAG: hypothetical protein C0494_06780 [Sphingobium sp.]|nr:hypothetical protein [Sphingobium sp.]
MAIVPKCITCIDVGNDKAVTILNAPDTSAVQVPFGEASFIQEQSQARYVAVDCRVDFAARPHNAARLGILAGTDIRESRVRTGIDPCRMT